MELTLLVAWFMIGVLTYTIIKIFFSNHKNTRIKKQPPSPPPHQNLSASPADTSVSSTKSASPIPPTEEHHYRVNRNLFTKSETLFFSSLEQALEGRLRIFGKVRIADVLNVKKGLTKREWGFQFGRIKAKHFDYVLCDPKTLKVVCAIELDDSSHERPDRIKRDEFVNVICKKAGLKLHRFNVKMHYDVEQIRERIFPSKSVAVSVDMKQPPLITSNAKELRNSPEIAQSNRSA